MFDYISRLFYDFAHEKYYFNAQILRDINYYGKEQLKQKCLETYTELFHLENESELSNPLQILKLFSFFISSFYTYDHNNKKIPKLDISHNKYLEFEKLYKNLKRRFEKNHLFKLLDMFEGIKYLLDNISFDVRFENANLELLLETAIKSRFNKNYNNFRIVNCKKDNLDYLEIDCYCLHIIIEAKNEYYWKNKEIIVNAIERHFKIRDGKNEIQTITFKKSYEKIKSIHYLYKKLPQPLNCIENGINILVNPDGYSKTGFFIDNRNIRKYLEKNSEGKSILNLCSFTCTLGALAKKSGAKEVINVDKEKKYIMLGKEIYKNNNIKINNYEFVVQRIEDYFKKNNGKRKYDIVIMDLPEIAAIPCDFFDKEKTYRDYNKNALNLLKSGGILITSCCSHGFSRERFDKVIKEFIDEKKYIKIDYNFDELDDHPTDKNDIYSDYLKIYGIQKLN